jgi:hypothetical protein
MLPNSDIFRKQSRLNFSFNIKFNSAFFSFHSACSCRFLFLSFALFSYSLLFFLIVVSFSGCCFKALFCLLSFSYLIVYLHQREELFSFFQTFSFVFLLLLTSRPPVLILQFIFYLVHHHALLSFFLFLFFWCFTLLNCFSLTFLRLFSTSQIIYSPIPYCFLFLFSFHLSISRVLLSVLPIQLLSSTDWFPSVSYYWIGRTNCHVCFVLHEL